MEDITQGKRIEMPSLDKNRSKTINRKSLREIEGCLNLEVPHLNRELGIHRVN